MTESKLFEDDVPYVSTEEFHADREAVSHVDQPWHKARMAKTMEFVYLLLDADEVRSITDLGCGDGGFLSLLERTGVPCWGYDFQPANIPAGLARGVDIRQANFLTDDIEYGDLAIATEVIEHLAHPHEFLAHLTTQVPYLICSSPQFETVEQHSPEHSWCWDKDGYRAMLANAGWNVLEHQDADIFQVVMARGPLS